MTTTEEQNDQDTVPTAMNGSASSDTTYTSFPYTQDDTVDNVIIQLEAKISPPTTVVFIYFIYNNFLVFASCFIIPGATREFSEFIISANDTPLFFNDTPDAAIGLATASFIGAYSAATLVAAHLVRIYKWKNLMVASSFLWSLSMLASGFSYYANSYWMLFSIRVMSGIFESPLAVIAPPMFKGRGSTHGGIWLALFLTAGPIGAAFGFCISAIIANDHDLGWQWLYFFYFLMTLPLVVALAFVKDDENDGMLAPDNGHDTSIREGQIFNTADDVEKSQERDDMRLSLSSPAPTPHHYSSIWEELKTCLSNDILIFITISNTIAYSIVAALGTFTASFILSQGIVHKEETAATIIGVVISLAGLIGSPIGGLIVDHIQSKLPSNASPATSLTLILPRVGQDFMCAIIFGILTCFAHHTISFMILSLICWIFHFCGQSGLQYAIMLSVDHVSDRPNAVAFATFCSGFLGGVPFPIIYGSLNDIMAPQCITDAKGDFVDEQGCVHEGRKWVRICRVLVWLYMLFCPLFLVIARKYAIIKVQKELSIRSIREGYCDNDNTMEDENRPLGLEDVPEIS